MLIVPVQPTPNQTLSALLDGQICQITLTTRFDGRLYFSLTVNNAEIVPNVICRNANLLVRYPYLGVIGDFWIFDTQGSDDPVYSSLGSRFLLQYLEESDLQAAQAAAIAAAAA